MQESEKKPEKKNLTNKQKKQITAFILVVILLLIILFFGKPFLKYINEVGRDNPYENHLLLPDLTGYYEDDAINELKSIGFVNIKREYIVDQYTVDGCVVKTNHHINSLLKPDEEIKIFICDEDLLKNTDYEVESNPENNPSANNMYFSLNGISIIDMKIKDGKFYFLLKNNTSNAIKNISYKIGYQNKEQYEIGSEKYFLDEDIIVLPGEKYLISDNIRNDNAYYLYVNGFKYESISVPENERK